MSQVIDFTPDTVSLTTTGDEKQAIENDHEGKNEQQSRMKDPITKMVHKLFQHKKSRANPALIFISTLSLKRIF